MLISRGRASSRGNSKCKGPEIARKQQGALCNWSRGSKNRKRSLGKAGANGRGPSWPWREDIGIFPGNGGRPPEALQL
jgi:hypothetical protein